MSKDKYKVTNWKAYNEGLKKRGSLRLWIQDDIAKKWKYSGITKRGGQKQYMFKKEVPYAAQAYEFIIMVEDKPTGTKLKI